VIATSRADDLAALRAETAAKSFLRLRVGVPIKAAEPVLVFGYPLAEALSSAGNTTVGNVTALAGVRDDSRFMQISAAVQPGNSGGPALDEAGRLIGVVVRSASTDESQAPQHALRFHRREGLSLPACGGGEYLLRRINGAVQLDQVSTHRLRPDALHHLNDVLFGQLVHLSANFELHVPSRLENLVVPVTYSKFLPGPNPSPDRGADARVLPAGEHVRRRHVWLTGHRLSLGDVARVFDDHRLPA